jgi:hypothetical protein
MAINWQDVITTVGGQGVFLAAAAWIIKSLLSHGLARDAEAYKTRLKTLADIEVEKLKNTLQLITVEHQVRFSKLHETRAEVIATVYARLVDMYQHGRLYVFANQNHPQLMPYMEVQKEVFELFEFIQRNRIYLSEELCTRLEKLVGDLQQVVSTTSMYASIETPNAQSGSYFLPQGRYFSFAPLLWQLN